MAGRGSAGIPGERARQKGQDASVTPNWTGERTAQKGHVHSVMRGVGLGAGWGFERVTV